MRTIWRSMRQTKAIKGKQLHVEETYWSTNQAARSQGTVRCIEPFTSGSTTSFYCTRIEEVGAQPVWLVLLPSLQPFRRQSAMQNSQQTRRATFSTTNICTQHWSRDACILSRTWSLKRQYVSNYERCWTALEDYRKLHDERWSTKDIDDDR